MNPMDSAKWSVELKITIEASIRILNHDMTFFLIMKLTVFDSKIGVFNIRFAQNLYSKSCRYDFFLSNSGH